MIGSARAVVRQLITLQQQTKYQAWDFNGDFRYFMCEDQWEAARKVELEITELATYVEGDDMADKAKKKQVQWRGFKDVRLSDAQRDGYDHWDAHDEDVYLLAASAVSSGFKFTCSYNNSNDTYTATLTGQDSSPAAAQGYSLSAFAPTWYDAVRTLMYKHDVILEGDWSKIEVSASERWG